MTKKLEKLLEDRENARRKRDLWETRLKELEEKYREQEKTEIHEAVVAEDLTPEQVLRLIRYIKGGQFGAALTDIVGQPKEKQVAKDAGKTEPPAKESVKPGQDSGQKTVTVPETQKGKQGKKNTAEKEKEHDDKS